MINRLEPAIWDPFVSAVELPGGIALFQPLSCGLLYGNETLASLWKKRKMNMPFAPVEKSSLHNLFRTLWRLGMIGESTRMPSDDLLATVRERICALPKLRQFIPIVTNRCNLACTYCVTTQDLDAHTKNVSMERCVLDKGIDLFCLLADKGRCDKEVIYFGGEPLLVLDELLYAGKRFRDISESDALNGRVRQVVFTNGLTLSQEVFDQLESLGIQPIVSVDGVGAIHDAHRIDASGRGSFDRVCKNLASISSRKPHSFGLSVLVTRANWRSLPDTISELNHMFKPINFGLSLKHNLLRKEDLDEVTHQATTHAMIVKTFEMNRNDGIYIEQIMRRIRPLCLCRLRTKECPALGHRLILATDGRVGLCTSFLAEGRGFIAPIAESGEQWDRICDAEWCSRSPFFLRGEFNRCRGCLGLAVCGGGCTHDALRSRGTLLSLDERRCAQAIAFTEWYIRDLWRQPNASKHVAIHGFWEPKEVDRRIPLGSVEPESLAYPCQIYSLFSEIDAPSIGDIPD